MEIKTSSKRIKTNNDNIILVPNIVIKYILQLLYDEDMKSNHGQEYYDLSRCYSWGKPYCMVSWYWFSVCQQLYCFSDNHFWVNDIKNKLNRNIKQEEKEKEISTTSSVLSLSSSSNRVLVERNPYFINIDLIKSLKIHIDQISKELIESINVGMTMLENIRVINQHYTEFIYKPLTVFSHLNKLRKNIKVEFYLYIEAGTTESIDSNPDYQPFTFNTTKFQLSFDCIPSSHAILTRMIRDIQPKSLFIDSTSHTDSGGSHLHCYHSLSRLCQFECIEIKSDFIPLYSLYRFLQTPKLNTFKFNLQFHFISSLYNNSFNNNNNNQIYNLNFNQLDQFSIFNNNNNNNIITSTTSTTTMVVDENEQQQQQKRNLHKYKVYDNQWYLEKGNTVNEDNQIFCGYDKYVEGNDVIPPYSLQLWNECLSLLRENKTITELSIGQCYCSDQQFHSPVKSSELLISDIIHTLSNNKSIKKLTLEGDYGDDLNDPINFCTPLVIVEILESNSTLEFLYIQETGKNQSFIDHVIDEIRQTTKNKKCKVLKSNIEYY